MPKKRNFEKQGCQVGEMNRTYLPYARWVVEMEDVTLINNATLCTTTTRQDVVVWRGTMHKELLNA